MEILDEEMWRKTTKENEIDMLGDIAVPSDAEFTFDARVKNENMNTILHCITMATVLKENKEYYTALFGTILEAFVQWELRRGTPGGPADVRYRAVQHITTGVENGQKTSVLHLALEIGSVHISKQILQMENVNFFTCEKAMFYDVTHILPLGLSRASQKPIVNRVDVEDHESSTTNFGRPKYLPVLMNSTTLELNPVKEILNIYSRVIYWIYIPWTILHVLHISLFTYSSISLLDINAGRFNFLLLPERLIETLEGILYYFVPVEPALFFVWFLYTLCSLAIQTLTCPVKHVTVMLNRTVFSVFNFGYCVMVFVFLDTYLKAGPHQHIILSVTLWLGWLMTLDFARSFPQFHYFLDILMYVLVSLVTFILVCVVFILAFTCAFHVQIQLTLENEGFGSTMFKLFQALIGEDEIFSDAFEASILNSGGSIVYLKIIFIIFSILCTIVFLNFVIAVVNDVYSNLVTRKNELWATHSLLLGVYLHMYFPWLVNVVIKRQIRHGPLAVDDRLGVHTDGRWFVVVRDIEKRSTVPAFHIHVDEQKTISERLDKIEEKLEKLEFVTHRLDKIDVSLQRIMGSIRPDK